MRARFSAKVWLCGWCSTWIVVDMALWSVFYVGSGEYGYGVLGWFEVGRWLTEGETDS